MNKFGIKKYLILKIESETLKPTLSKSSLHQMCFKNSRYICTVPFHMYSSIPYQFVDYCLIR